MTEEIIDEYTGQPYRPLADCPKCLGGGFLHPAKQDGTIDYGHAIPCDHPGCLRDSINQFRKGDIVENSGVVGTEQTFENFNPKIPGVEKAYRAAKKIAAPDCDFIWLIIYGGVGNGKTHLLNAVANKVMERGITVRLVMMAELLSEMRRASDTKKMEYLLLELKKVPFLLIDEYGLEFGTPWEKEKEEELLAARWNNGRFTVLATNRDIEELPERIKSRFKDWHLSRWVRNEAEDYRLKRR